MSATASVPAAAVLPRSVIGVWQMPLAPIALALTVGIVADRLVGVLLPFSVGLSLACLVAWLIHSRGRDPTLALVYLWGAAAGLGCGYHHWYRDIVPADDIRHFATKEPQPVRVVGVLAREPILTPPRQDPLQTFPRVESTRWVLRAKYLHRDSDGRPVSGLVQATVSGSLARSVHVGDEVEVTGNLSLPRRADNPGEFDYAEFLRDQRIGAVLAASASPESVVLVRRGWPSTIGGWLAVVRGWAKDVLAEHIDVPHHTVAWALLLGDGAAMTREDWDAYQRTGVIHVLAISGQHLVVLAGFLWFCLRLARIRPRHGALAVVGLLLFYALLTGAQPPVMRAAWTVLAYCVGMMLGRRVLPANIFALAWIGVLLFNPTDAFNTGCQLSFVAVAMLYWGTGHWREAEAEPDPLQQLIEESRPRVVNWLLRGARWLAWLYFINFAVWVAVTPLVAGRFHMVAPVALILGPVMVLLTSIALLAGFGLLLTSWLGPVAWLFAAVTQLCLAGCAALVQIGLKLPFAYTYLPDVPDWWLAAFYIGLLATLTLDIRSKRRWVFGQAAVWFGLVVLLHGVFRAAEFHCTFLAVGHGGCTVVETPDGQVILYDAGAMAGPDVTRRQIAPYLWHRGFRTVDEVILSHGDLDHFNGLPALLERFRVRRVTLTPSFADRPTEGVRLTLAAFAQHEVQTRIVRAGEHWETGGITWEVLHPPAAGPEGKENARSLVLHLTYQTTTILLTGDLEEPGLSQVLAKPPRPVQVLMAPHHGSRFSNTPELAKWARPQVVISSQGPPQWNAKVGETYEKLGSRFLATWQHGAVSIREEEGIGWIQTHRSQLKIVLKK